LCFLIFLSISDHLYRSKGNLMVEAPTKKNDSLVNIGKIVDDAMVAIGPDNRRLKRVLPKDFARPCLDKHRLGELIDLIGAITLIAASEGEQRHRSVDLLGRVYEYFPTRFASAEGKKSRPVLQPVLRRACLRRNARPYKDRIYDPFCGSGGMFVQSEMFAESHGRDRNEIQSALTA
jgi:type I restriction enzyme M protein